MTPDDPTLLQMAIEYIDRKRDEVQGEIADLERQLIWLDEQKRELLGDARRERLGANGQAKLS